MNPEHREPFDFSLRRRQFTRWPEVACIAGGAVLALVVVGVLWGLGAC